MSSASPKRGKQAQEPLRIVIKADGRVAFAELTREMLELARELAPGDARLQARAALAGEGKREADEAEPA